MNEHELFDALTDTIKSCQRAQINITKNKDLTMVEVHKAKDNLDLVHSDLKKAYQDQCIKRNEPDVLAHP